VAEKATDIAKSVPCTKCGGRHLNNCCGTGGSWEGLCSGHDHSTVPGKPSWGDGFKACRDFVLAHNEEDKKKKPPQPEKVERPSQQRGPTSGLSKWSDVSALDALFKHGRPSNSLSQAGLLIHCFDQMEAWPENYRPCTSGWCWRASKWWSTSIINADLIGSFGAAGIILSPNNRVLCSSPSDFGSGGSGCHAHRVFQPNNTKGMLQYSKHAGGYNEVLIDSKYFVDNLPSSVAAMVYGLRGGDEAKSTAVHAYLAFLRTYNLTHNQVPLLRAKYNVDLFGRGTGHTNGPAFVDESASARTYLRKHPYIEEREKWLNDHPELRNHPERTRDVLSRRRPADAADPQRGAESGEQESDPPPSSLL
jgi:hypothetical protein